ncbi:MAG: hypothetical protein MK074_05655 [Phycisphaerales bacterium]|nr:hypothetical protein [Phycisphaerales bacterium]
MNGPHDDTELELATTWFLAARAMTVARGHVEPSREATAGLYGRAMLGLDEELCLAAKTPEQIGSRTLVDCLASIRAMGEAEAARIVTGVMLIAYADASMHPLEVRWASMLASAAGLNETSFQACCVNARVIAGLMTDPHIEEGE